MATNSEPQMKPLNTCAASFSKAVQPETSTFIEWWVWLVPEWLDRFWYKIYRFFRAVRRSIAYARFGWNNHDYDHSYFLDALRFKLQRMYAYLVKETNTKQEKPVLQSLRLAVRLAEKLTNDDYHYFLDQHDKKWGPAEMETTPAEDGFKGSLVTFKRPKATSKKKIAQERKEFRQAVESDEQIRARDARWLFSIMEKYYQHWWD